MSNCYKEILSDTSELLQELEESDGSFKEVWTWAVDTKPKVGTATEPTVKFGQNVLWTKESLLNLYREALNLHIQIVSLAYY